MSRTLHVYPKAIIDGSEWKLIVKVGDSRFIHTVAAGVTAEVPLLLLKIVFDLIVGDDDTDQDVDDALFVDDIRPGPQVETVWGNWQATAESIITGLDPGYTVADFWAAWTRGNTEAMRNDANRALVAGPGGIGRGWDVPAGTIHQHEGDGTTVDF